MSDVKCQMSNVRCQMSDVKCNISGLLPKSAFKQVRQQGWADFLHRGFWLHHHGCSSGPHRRHRQGILCAEQSETISAAEIEAIWKPNTELQTGRYIDKLNSHQSWHCWQLQATKWNETDYFLLHNKTLPIPKVGNFSGRRVIEKMMIRKYTIGFNCVDAVRITSLKNTGQNYL